MRRAYLALLPLFALSGCFLDFRQDKVDRSASRDGDFRGRISYAMVRAEVFDRACLRCHDRGDRIPLNDYAAVRERLDRIETAVFSRSAPRPMPQPPSPPLSVRQWSMLRAWIDDGAPEYVESVPDPEPSASPSPEVTIPLEPTWESLRANVFEPKCVACHSRGSDNEDARRIPLTDLDEILASPLDLVVPGNPDDSGIFIYTTLPDDDSDLMPPRDSGKSPLTAAEREALRQWILALPPGQR